MLDPLVWKPGVPVRVDTVREDGVPAFVQSDVGFAVAAAWRERLFSGEDAKAVAMSLWESEFEFCAPRVSWVLDVASDVDEYQRLVRAAAEVTGIQFSSDDGSKVGSGSPGELDLVLRMVMLWAAVGDRLVASQFEGAANRMLESFAPRFGRGVLSLSEGRPLLTGVSGFDAALYGVWLWREHSRLCQLCGKRFVRQFDGPHGFAKSSAMYCSRRCAMVQASRMYRSRMADGASGERSLMSMASVDVEG